MSYVSPLATLLGVPLVLLMGACSLVDGDPAEPLPIQNLIPSSHAMTYSGITDERRMVIRDQDTWAEIWEEIWQRVMPRPELPVVDFDEQMVLLASMGSRPSTGYSIEFEGARRGGGRLVVGVRSVSPAPRCGVGHSITQPVAVARVPAVEQPVRFDERSLVRRCG